MTSPGVLQFIPLEKFPLIDAPCDLAEVVVACLQENNLTPEAGDVLVVAHKVISKAEGQVVALSGLIPSEAAKALAERMGKEPELVEVILRESRRVVREAHGVLICEHRLGFICANAGVDRSNAGEDRVVLLPQDPTRSAQTLSLALKRAFNVHVPVLAADTHGRPWREGAVGICIGYAGLDPFLDYRGQDDLYGYEMQTEVECVADELCSAATLVMGQGREGVPVALVRGGTFPAGKTAFDSLLRDPERDLFR